MLDELVVFPDAAAVVCSALADELELPTGTKVPNPRPPRFYRIIRTGGPRHTIVSDAAQLTVESWGEDDEDAHDLAQMARAILHMLPGTVVDGIPVYRVEELSGPADLPDPLSDHPRYSQTFAVHVRGAVEGEATS